jgi:hypothetical protein
MPTTSTGTDLSAGMVATPIEGEFAFSTANGPIRMQTAPSIESKFVDF